MLPLWGMGVALHLISDCAFLIAIHIRRSGYVKRLPNPLRNHRHWHHLTLPLPISPLKMSKTLLEWTSSRSEKRQFGKSFRISCSIQATKVKHPALNAANRYIMHALTSRQTVVKLNISFRVFPIL